MTIKRMSIWGIILGVLTASALVTILLLTVLIDQEARQPRVRIENGSVIHIEESRTLHIYLEDTAPPTLDSHEFVFTNIDNQSRIYSYTPNFTRAYAQNGVIVNDIPVSGTFGSLVAIVELEAGSYIIEYSVLEDSGVFVWGSYLNMSFFIILVGSILGCFALLVGFIVMLVTLLIKREELKRVDALKAYISS